jgi:hypothetical protein
MKAKIVAMLGVMMTIQLLLVPSIVNGSHPPWPLVSTSPVTGITDTTAVLNGELTRLTALIPTAIVSFQYGERPGVYTFGTTPQLMSDNATFSASISNLKPCTRYYVITKVTQNVAWMLRSPRENSIYGAGFGLGIQTTSELLFGAVSGEPCIDYGNEISFETTGCPTFIGTGPTSHQSGSMSGVGPPAPPTNLPNIFVQSAAIAVTKVAPGENVPVNINVINKGGSNGSSKITLYVNGQEVESKGITLASGETAPLHFSVSRNDPGIYTIHVNGTSAGSFTVDEFTNNNILIFSIIALFSIGIIGVLYLIGRRRPA